MEFLVEKRHSIKLWIVFLPAGTMRFMCSCNISVYATHSVFGVCKNRANIPPNRDLLVYNKIKTATDILLSVSSDIDKIKGLKGSAATA